MKTNKSAKEAANRSGNLPYDLTPFLPGNDNIGPLKDMAQEITAASAGLEGKVATDTATALGDQLRLNQQLLQQSYRRPQNNNPRHRNGPPKGI